MHQPFGMYPAQHVLADGELVVSSLTITAFRRIRAPSRCPTAPSVAMPTASEVTVTEAETPQCACQAVCEVML